MSGAGDLRAVLSAAGGAALLGLSPILVKLSELGPQATTFWRSLLALPVLVAWARLSERQPQRRQIGWLLIAGVLFGGELGLWAAALDFTTVANATLMSNMTPIFAVLFGWLLFRERPAAGVYAGGAAALIGALILSLSRAQAGAGPSSAHGWLGDLMGFGSAAGYAGYLIVVRSMGARISTGAIMAWATASAALTSAVLALAFGERFLPQTLNGWLVLAGLALVVQVMAQGFIAYGVGRLPIVISTILLWTQPVSAAALSWFIFGEHLTALALLGAGLVLIGVFVVQRARAPVEPEA